MNIDINALASNVGLFLKKNGPTIAFVAGLTSMTVGGALAVRKSLIRKYGENNDLTVTEVCEDFKKERETLEYDKQSVPEDADCLNECIRTLYIDEAKFLFKTYWLPVLLYTTGVALTVVSYRAIGIRLAVMTAAYDKLALSNAAILAKKGYEPEDNIDITQPEYTGNPSWDIDPCAVTGLPYSYWYCGAKFDGTMNPKWSASMNSNMTMLGCMFERLNTQLRTKGYVYLNELLENARIALEPEGFQVGWIYSLTEDVQNQIDFYATPYLIQDGKATIFDGDIIPEGADVRIALTVVPDGSIDKAVYSRLFKTL